MAGRMNNLTGKEWLQQSFSIWRDIEKTKDERKLKHPAMFPTQLTSRLIEIFTKDKGEVILDPFLGSGSTVISAYKLGKKGIGFDLSKEYVKLSKSRIKEYQLDLSQNKQIIKALSNIGRFWESIDLKYLLIVLEEIEILLTISSIVLRKCISEKIRLSYLTLTIKAPIGL